MKTFLPLLCLAALGMSSLTGVEGLFGSLFPGYGPSFFFLNQRLQKAERRGCQNGQYFAEICDPTTIATDALGFLECIFTFVTSGELTVIDLPVTFDTPFHKPPSVAAFLTGLFVADSKNCTVEPTAITETGFNITVTLGGLLPATLDVSWIACDQREP